MIQLGQKVFTTGGYPKTGDITECTVSKVGRLYFELKEHPRKKFEISSLRDCSDSNYIVRVYLSRQGIEDEREHNILSSETYLHLFQSHKEDQQ